MIRPEVQKLKEKILKRPRRWTFFEPKIGFRIMQLGHPCESGPILSKTRLCLSHGDSSVIKFTDEEILFLAPLFEDEFFCSPKTETNLTRLSDILDSI